MELKVIEREMSICKIKDISQVNFEDTFCFVAKTDEELSLVCASDQVPADCLSCDDGWRGFRIMGTLEFSTVGILAKLTTVLANARIGLFVIRTFHTDYVLVKKEKFDEAVNVLEMSGYMFV